jgi:GNAT superfamily N-acetyltransferase
MADEYTTTFEKLWVEFRARWCDSHDLGGALAFSHERVKIPMFHRVVQVDVDEEQVDKLIDDALQLFREKNFDCAFTLSPLNRPADLAQRLEQRGFTLGLQPLAMVCDQPAEPLKPGPAVVTVSDETEYDIWADVMCRSFTNPPAMGEVGRSVLCIPQVRRYLARVDGEPAGTTLLYSQYGMGYLDAVGTLPQHRHKGVATALVTRAVEDSRALGNRWATLETDSASLAEQVYKQRGFRTTHYRHRYIKTTR